MTTRKGIRYLLVLSLMVVPLVIVVCVIRAQKKSAYLQKLQGNQRVSKVVTRGTTQELAPWQSGQFIDVNSPTVLQIVGQTIKTAGSDLSENQRAKLHDLIERFFKAYSSGRFEDYFTFKTHGFQFRLDFDGPSENLINSLTKNDNTQLPNEPKAKLESLWELVTRANTNNGTGPRLTTLEMSSIKILITTNKVATSNLLKYATRASTMYPGFSPNYLVKYDRTPESEIAETGRLISALLEINAHYSSADVASPLFVTFYWGDRTEMWYSWQLARYQAARFRTLF